ncbi:glycosyl transferase family protein [Alteromonas macleodii str. 'English Channel 673']|uniref:Glycosyl transferase family protein n=1 Tax=Alteromonas macleodii (strain English Channel 673) TaxID=1004788 RepID=A0AB33A2Y6_ALTME|nr:glycosyltransferase [Alteromonas macleodii]AFT76049.1 glycosyl transferase family protein [Alteromonas macleodii str. 'English Channel 673']
MKKIAMRSVRAALQLIPKTLKDKLKQNERLTGLYVRSVRKSGLFFDAPTPKQTQALYNYWLEVNESAFSKSAVKIDGWQAIVFGTGNQRVTQEKVKSLGAETCLIIGELDLAVIKKQILQLDEQFPTLLLNGGDLIESSAISRLCNALKGNNIAYCDTDELDNNGTKSSPRFLPDWNPELQYSSAYINTGVIIETALLKSLNITNQTTIAEIVTELSLTIKSLAINHLPLPLVHESPLEKGESNTLECVKKVIEKYTKAKVETDEPFSVNRVCWPNTNPLVSLIIPTKNGKTLVKACIESILEKTAYQNYEILLIDNGSDEQESIEYFDYLDTLEKVRVIRYPAPFNYSAINNFGVEHAKGSILGLVNNDIEVISTNWLTYMVGHVERESVGCVGAKLLYSDTRIQHAGVVLGYGGGAGHAHKNFPRFHTGYLKRIVATNNYSAVTAACLLVKRTHFDAVNGLNQKDLSVAFNDVDFCLKVRGLGVNNVYCAEAELFHHESVSRGLDISPEKAARFNRELAYLKTMWSDFIANDPAYNRNLTLKRENFSIKSAVELKECHIRHN